MAKKKARPRKPELNVTRLTREEASIMREVEYIVRRAQEGNGRVVGFGSVVLFSTPTGDAWLLDPEDSYAMCLARGGERQPARIMENEARFAIDWPGTYLIDGDAFTYADKSGRITTIMGYPTSEILATIQRLGLTDPRPRSRSADDDL